MYLFRGGDVPVKEFSTVMPPALRPAVRLFGRQAMGVYPYRDLYMLAAARQFVPLMKNTKLILLGGITDREHVETGLAEGFDFVAMGRALLREPDRVKTMIAEPGSRSRCTHNNKCMVTVFGRTHCVLDPVQRYGHAGMPVALPTNRSPSARPACRRARWAMSSVGIVMNPWMPPSNVHRVVGTPAACSASA